jgi:transmembrane sensor
MSELRAPVSRNLAPEAAPPEADVRRLWLGIQARRRGFWRGLLRQPGAWRFAFAPAVAAACALWLWLATRAPVPAGPLTTRGGAALLTLGAVQPVQAELSDGSRIELAAESRVDVLDNDATRFVSALRRGAGRFEVEPGGPRRWTIEAGLATIEVVGTAFTVRRTDTEVEVAVEHGVVLVRGASVPDGVQRLSAGQRILVLAAKSIPPAAPSADAAAPAASSALPAALPVSSAEQAPRPAAPAVAVDAFEDALARADAERRSGNVNGAISALREALGAPSAPGRRAVAAFTLGKVLLDGAGRAAEAEAAFAECLASSPPAALAEDALARLAEAQARAGKLERAAATKREYQRLYPSGRRLELLEPGGPP